MARVLGPYRRSSQQLAAPRVHHLCATRRTSTHRVGRRGAPQTAAESNAPSTTLQSQHQWEPPAQRSTLGTQWTANTSIPQSPQKSHVPIVTTRALPRSAQPGASEGVTRTYGGPLANAPEVAPLGVALRWAQRQGTVGRPQSFGAAGPRTHAALSTSAPLRQAYSCRHLPLAMVAWQFNEGWRGPRLVAGGERRQPRTHKPPRGRVSNG